MEKEIEQLKQKAIEERWTSFLEWINYLSPWNFWIDHNDKSKGLKPHIVDKLSELEQAVREEVIKSLIEWANEKERPRGRQTIPQYGWQKEGIADAEDANNACYNQALDDLRNYLHSQL